MSASSSTSSLASTLVTPASPALLLKDIVVSEEDKTAAAALKQSANKAFQEQNLTVAAALYSQAIGKNPKDATIYCNRGYTRMKLEENGYAIHDLNNAIELDDSYVKAYYRRALCQLSIFRPQLAVSDLRKCLVLDPKNALAKSQLDATLKLIRRIDFEKAIEVGEEISAVDRCLQIISEGGCELEKDYGGPKMDITDGKHVMTQDFLDAMLEHFKAAKLLPRRYVWEITLGCFNIVRQEESLVDVVLEKQMTCDVIGDIHGQFYDLLHLLSITGKPSASHCLLFNGDWVDRGSWSMEVVLTLFAYKWLYPKRIYLNRGNHETKDMNKMYGFQGECEKKHGEMSYKLFSHVFTAMPLATLISATMPAPSKVLKKPILSPQGMKRHFVVHGGLFSRDGVTLDEIRRIDRIGKQPGNEGLMCAVDSHHCPDRTHKLQLLWTDPQEQPGRGPSKRGVGIAFGPDVTRRWCTENGVTGIIRSHEVRQDGYAVEHDGLCTTVFSAPNYVDQVGNRGAFVRIDDRGEHQYVQFDAQPHPPLKPMAYASQFASMM